MPEIQAFYTECRLAENDALINSMLAARCANATDKGYKDFKKSLDSITSELRKEVEGETVDGDSLKGKKGGFSNLFQKVLELTKAAPKKG